MEVFMRNVPKDLSDTSLKRELGPFMNALGIVDWSCQKPKRKNQAWVVFLVESDGKKFLKKHEKQVAKLPPPNVISPSNGVLNLKPRFRTVARLQILKTDIFVEKSTRPVDEYALKNLAFEKEERNLVVDRDPKAPAINAPVRQISCGKNAFTSSNTLNFLEQCRGDAHGIAKFGRRYLTVLIQSDFRIDVPYNIIQDLIAEPSGPSLTFVLTEPPRFYTKSPLVELNPHHPPWERTSQLDFWPAHSKYVAHCLVYRMSIVGSYFHDTINALKSRDLLSVTRQYLPVQQNPRPYEEDYSTCMTAFEGKIQSLGGTGKSSLVPFVILFQVQALVWNNYLHPANGLKMLEMMEAIARDCKRAGEKLPFTTDSMKQLFQTIPYPCPGTDPLELHVGALLEKVINVEEEARAEDPLRTDHYGVKLPDHQAWVLKAMVTPTRVVLHGPDAESKNRVLRMFPKNTEYFIRVTFCDEDGQDLAFNPKVKNDAVFARYRKVLAEGLQIAGRRFSFLGFSHSSLRSHSAWFSAPFVDGSMTRQDYHTIITALGDFRGIRVPAKCAARIGQAFSETPYAVPVFDCDIKIRWIDDVKSKDGSRVFSDGVGTISWDAMEEVWEHLPMKSATPTCFQIRLAGVKGILSLDTRLEGKVICLRKESMMKFESNDYKVLGICDTASKPLRLVLNRQLIKILEDMGTSNEWFMGLQNKALNLLRGVTATATNTSTFLEHQLIGTNVGLPRLIRNLNKMGIDYRCDRFMKSVVEHVVLRELRLLKHKARIPVDKGVTLFGVMDETGFLEEGEVYVTYNRKHGKTQGLSSQPLTDGPVIVTRSPALHPGDIQYVRMVTPPHGRPLLELENCIAFSQKGARDLPSQLSGGDLDGDLYSVIWDPDARPKRQFTPADYPRVVPEPLDREVTRDDITDFFINFMENDILGLIATRHQIVADIKERGTVDPECINLAEMHSTAVDYSKTGIPVNLQHIPKAPRTRPDFLAPAPPVQLYDIGQIDHIGEHDRDDDGEEDGMGMAKHRFHKSEKILGHLYRGVDEKKIWNEDVHRPVMTDGPSVWDQLLGRVKAALQAEGYGSSEVDYMRKLESAWKIRELYETTIVGNMWHFSDNPRVPISEVEAFCGSILNKTGSQTRRQRDSSIKLKEEMDGVMTWIVKLIRDRGVGSGDDEAASTTMTEDEQNERERMNAVELCWACVVVGCAKDSGAAADKSRTLLESFRVVAACCLVKELADLLNKKGMSSAGGYLGVQSGGHRQQMVLPMR